MDLRKQTELGYLFTYWGTEYIHWEGCFLVTIKILQAPVPIFTKLVLSIIKILLKFIPVHSQS